MYLRKAVIMVSVVLIVLCLGTIVLQSTVNSVSLPQNVVRQPVFTVRITRYVCQIDSETSKTDTWLYVHNPSRDMETSPEDPTRKPVHVVEVDHLTVKTVLPDGSLGIVGLYPDGTIRDELTGDEFVSEPYRERWDPIVYPCETSLVFFVGWTFLSEYGTVPGIYKYTYILTVTFEGKTFELEREFNILVTPA